MVRKMPVEKIGANILSVRSAAPSEYVTLEMAHFVGVKCAIRTAFSSDAFLVQRVNNICLCRNLQYAEMGNKSGFTIANNYQNNKCIV